MNLPSFYLSSSSFPIFYVILTFFKVIQGDSFFSIIFNVAICNETLVAIFKAFDAEAAKNKTICPLLR